RARWPPEHQRMEQAPIEGLPQRAIRTEQRLLPDNVVERAGTHAFGEGCARRGRDRLVVGKQRTHCRDSRVGRVSSQRTREAVVAAFSELTLDRIGTVTRVSACSISAGGRPVPSLPISTRIGGASASASSAAPPEATVAATR